MAAERIVRVSLGGGARWGLLSPDGRTLRLLPGKPWEGGTAGSPMPFEGFSLLPPAEPTKIVGVGLNYAGHAAEMGQAAPPEPVLFFKPPQALAGPGAVVRIPPESGRVDHEAELGFVVGRRLRRADPVGARAAVLGFTCANDVTARDLQQRDGQWARAKGFDGFCPLGPWLVPDFEEGDREITCRVNGAVRQRARLSDRFRDAAQLLSFISTVTTLEPGDVVLTGTPPGIGPLLPGDEVEVEIEGIGVLRNTVEAEA